MPLNERWNSCASGEDVREIGVIRCHKGMYSPRALVASRKNHDPPVLRNIDQADRHRNLVLFGTGFSHGVFPSLKDISSLSGRWRSLCRILRRPLGRECKFSLQPRTCLLLSH